MPIHPRILEIASEAAHWRRHLHQYPELQYEVRRTAAYVEGKLREFGCDEVVGGIGQTGVVGLILGREGPGPTLALRADMDALPIQEETGKPYASQIPGAMHACGHDGHTATLLGAARYLCETRKFKGAAAMVFQPAEEGGAGALAMCRDGLMERFGVARIFGLHNLPGLPIGGFATRAGPLMASTNPFDIIISGRGGHAAKPHECVDPILIGAHVIAALQTIAARTIDPLNSVVVSVTKFNAGTAYNVIPGQARISGTIRALDAATRQSAIARLIAIAEGTAKLHLGWARVEVSEGYPVCVNHKLETELAVEIARGVAGADNVADCAPPMMGGEDFAYMLQARPGAFMFMGNGASAGLHHPAYDFNDAAIPYGISFFVGMAERQARDDG